MGKQLKTFKSEFICNYKNIMIPLLQRDYVQGGRLDVISPLLDKLISALTTENKQVGLNYIYGYNYDEKFVPIDGQQRLITLWLLHLYIYARQEKMSDFKVELQFESREFAHNFCEKLLEKIAEILKEKTQEKESDSSNQQSLKEKIVDSDWFVSGWQQDTTVENMLKSLQLIDDKLRGKVIGTVHEDNIGFDFKELKNGLDDDIYVKMNGRGRPLSYFENLKSWMDKQVQTLFGKKDDFTKQWQIKMDNDWTDLFWKNRNKKKEKPEEIDDEWMRFLYSMLFLYWIQDDNNSCFLESFRVNEGESQDDVKSGYIAFLNEWRREEDKKLPDNATADQLRERTFSLLQKGDKMIPLYWIEKTNIFGNKEVFIFISESLDTLASISEKVNGIREDFVKSLDFDDKSSVLYQIAFKDATYNKTLPMLYALVKTPKTLQNTDIDVLRWIRFWRNLVINSTITSKDLNDVCRTISEIAKKSEKKELYQILKYWQRQEKMGFAKAQVNEEIAKAKQILDGEHRSDEKSWEDIITCAENSAFFKGAIRFLFTDENGEVNDESWGGFGAKWANAQKFFDQNGVKSDCQKGRVLFKKFLKYISNFDSLYEFYFDDSLDNWRSNILLNDKLAKCVDKLLTEAPEEKRDNWDNSQRRVFEDLTEKDILLHIEKGYELDIRNGFYLLTMKGRGNGQDWKRYFIGIERNSILSKLYGGNICEKAGGNKIYSSQKINNCGFFWGEHINFKYKNHFFRWYGYPNEEELDVYLMEDNWADYKERLIRTSDKGTDEDNYHCFKVDETDSSDSFVEKLDNLIKQAKSDQASLSNLAGAS